MIRKTMGGDFHGLEITLRAFPGARAVRVIHPAGQRIDPHRHDWVCLTLPVVGGGGEHYDGGEARLDGTSGVLHPSGILHADQVEGIGLETVSIQLDLSWFGPRRPPCPKQSRAWHGGRCALAARRLAQSWAAPSSTEATLKAETRCFLELVSAAEDGSSPTPWVGAIVASLDPLRRVATHDLSRQLGLHPAWITRVYRAAMGEGLAETLRRRRIELAIPQLRSSDRTLAEIALDSGFCDQSHMNRCFRALLGRTPLQVRRERGQLEGLR